VEATAKLRSYASCIKHYFLLEIFASSSGRIYRLTKNHASNNKVKVCPAFSVCHDA